MWELPPVHQQCIPYEIANALGFLAERASTCLNNPALRAKNRIENWADTHLTLHWRLRQYSLRPEHIDLVSYVAKCKWGPLRTDDLEIQDNDLSVAGVRIDKLEKSAFQELLSITRERHQAFNWLLGFERLYSEITTDT